MIPNKVGPDVQPAAHLRLVADRAGDASGIKLSGVSKTSRTRDGDVPSLRPLELKMPLLERVIVVAAATLPLFVKASVPVWMDRSPVNVFAALL